MGKIPRSLLRKYVLPRTGAERDDVIVGPHEGVDVAVMSAGGDTAIVAHSDPIVGALRRIGWLAVNIACNDVATSGVRPRWVLPTILLPEEWDEEMLDEITRDIDDASRELGVAVVGGHTGYAVGSSRPIVVVTAVGAGRRDDVITSTGAKAGDSVYITKGAGIEGTAILASDFRDVLIEKGVSEETIERAGAFMNEISVVEEAVALAEAKAVTAMHDATRGGVAEALAELAAAAGKTVEVWGERIPIRLETKVFSEAMDFDPLWMISSGTLVFTAPPENAETVRAVMEGLGIEYAKIGVVREGAPEVLLHRGERTEVIKSPQPEKDELARLWELYPQVK
jgi:hydrogenase expression/formation protein HypE